MGDFPSHFHFYWEIKGLITPINTPFSFTWNDKRNQRNQLYQKYIKSKTLSIFSLSLAAAPSCRPPPPCRPTPSALAGLPPPPASVVASVDGDLRSRSWPIYLALAEGRRWIPICTPSSAVHTTSSAVHTQFCCMHNQFCCAQPVLLYAQPVLLCTPSSAVCTTSSAVHTQFCCMHNQFCCAHPVLLYAQPVLLYTPSSAECTHRIALHTHVGWFWSDFALILVSARSESSGLQTESRFFLCARKDLPFWSAEEFSRSNGRSSVSVVRCPRSRFSLVACRLVRSCN